MRIKKQKWKLSGGAFQTYAAAGDVEVDRLLPVHNPQGVRVLGNRKKKEGAQGGNFPLRGMKRIQPECGSVIMRSERTEKGF
jgi:hypothetical protein